MARRVFVFRVPVVLVQQCLQFSGDVVGAGRHVGLISGRRKEGVQVVAEGGGCGVVEDESGRQTEPGGGFEPVA